MKPFHHLVRIALVFAFALGAFGAAAAEQPVVNVNTAETSQLTLLPRVGPALAQRIIEHREANGKFERSEDLLLVRGIGDKTFALMEPYVTVDGKTTLQDKLRVSDLQRRADEAAKAKDDDQR